MNRVVRWLFALICMAVALLIVGDRVRDFYHYQAGTPATATSIRCQSEIARGAAGSENTHCTGTWTVGGQSQTGPIEPVPNAPNFHSTAPLAVRVTGGTAYTAESVGGNFRWALLLGLVPIAVGAGALFGVDQRWRERRRRRLHRRWGLTPD